MRKLIEKSLQSRQTARRRTDANDIGRFYNGLCMVVGY